jgi:hypothetical protein
LSLKWHFSDFAGNSQKNTPSNWRKKPAIFDAELSIKKRSESQIIIEIGSGPSLSFRHATA